MSGKIRPPVTTEPTPDAAIQAIKQQFSHYFRACPFDGVDVYRVLLLFGVTDPCIQHAVKKLLVAGGRGGKDIDKDVSEAVASLRRWQDMRQEEAATAQPR